jgi:hypothetical protein
MSPGRSVFERPEKGPLGFVSPYAPHFPGRQIARDSHLEEAASRQNLVFP